MNKLGLESAFPVEIIERDYLGCVESRVQHLGMSKRFYAACAAMQGIVTNYELLQDCIKDSRTQGKSHQSYIAEYAYEIADELLKQEQDE